MPRIVILHDDAVIGEMLCHLLGSAGYTAAAYPTTAAPLIRQAPPDLLILDIPAHHARIGWTVLDYLTTDPTTAPIPLLVCSTSPAVLADVQQRGVPTFPEPFQVADLLALVAARLKAAPPRAYAGASTR